MSGDPRFEYEPILDAVSSVITERPVTIIAVFVALTAGFALGLPYIALDPGEGGFTEGTEEQQALEAVNEEFDRPFAQDEQTTQIIHRSENVLSRESVLRMLRLQQEIETNPELRVRETSSPAEAVAIAIDPDAETRAAQIRAVEEATEPEVREAARLAIDRNPALRQVLSDDYNREDARASALLGTVTHEVPAGQSEEYAAVQHRVADVADRSEGDFTAFGSAIFEDEFEQALIDSLSLMVPAVIILILGFLLIAYRDPFDLVLGLVALFMTVIWTFGFVGHLRIPFNQMMVAVPPLLLAVGIDFGIHSVNRYREERIEGAGIHEGMTVASTQLLVAFFIVTGTTVIGFGANMTSDLPAIYDFGFVAAMGITFTFLIFGVFMPAAKVLLDDLRAGTRIPRFGVQPLGSEDSRLGRVLPLGAKLANRGPAIMLAVLLVATAGAGYVGTDVDTSFDDEAFLPYEEPPAYIDVIPQPLGPGEYEVRGIVSFLGENFETGEDNEVTVYIEGPLYQDHTLESVHRAGEDPPPTIVEEGNRADSESIIDVIRDYAAEDEEFAALVERSDTSGNGVPDRNLDLIYDRLLSSPYEQQALQYMTEDRQSMRVVYSVDAEASQEAITRDARTIADRNRMDATATGSTIVFQKVTELLFQSAVVSLSVALLLTGLFLIVIYDILEGRASLGLANIVPIVSTVAFLAATMVVLDIPFNALTATALSITIGIGVDHSVHVTHRFIDEYNDRGDGYESLLVTMRGTGGGITGSVITTAGGVWSLVLSVTPMLGEFGFLMAISVLYSYLAVLVVLPPTLLLWERFFGDDQAASAPVTAFGADQPGDN